MEWTRSRSDDVVTEWERSDGYATVRLRERSDGDVVVRLDVMEQAVDGRVYQRERHADRDDALERAAEWREAYTPDE